MTGGRSRRTPTPKRRRNSGGEGTAPAVLGHSLGCRLNAYENEALVDQLVRRCGFVRTDDPGAADVIVVSTCAVTARSTARSRKTARTLRRRSGALLVLTGCVAQVLPEELPSGPDVLLLPNDMKSGAADMVARALGIRAEPAGPTNGALFPDAAPASMSRTRAFLKVQDGCDNRCSYCIVPAARGASRSQPREVVLRQAETLAASGYREILLTGVDLVSYGRDLYGGSYGLPELVRELLRLGGFRLRLSSMEPIGLSSSTLERLALPGVCRHLHLPAQSGSDRILARMGRRYGAGDMTALLDRSMELFPGLALGLDVIAGFPGETKEDFRMTLELVGHPAVTYLHVFPFSPRPGTPAGSPAEERLHTEVVTARAAELREAGMRARREFRRRSVGEDALALVEGRSPDGAERLICMTDNYIPLLAPEGATEGELLHLRIRAEDVCWGTR